MKTAVCVMILSLYAVCSQYSVFCIQHTRLQAVKKVIATSETCRLRVIDRVRLVWVIPVVEFEGFAAHSPVHNVIVRELKR